MDVPLQKNTAMAPLIPRMHLFEIDDQWWFPPCLRVRVQDILTVAWEIRLWGRPSAAQVAASVLARELGADLSAYAVVDFCAGGGGPTPVIERTINSLLASRGAAPMPFLLTDLHPNQPAWETLTRGRPHLTYERASVDASRAPERLVRHADRVRVLRLFNLAFHHFDDGLARRILRDAIRCRQPVAIFELQDRSVAGAVTILLLGLGIILAAPWIAWRWRSPAGIVFTYLLPILPFVLVFDGFVSALRTRTADELEALLHDCGADASAWTVRSGRQLFWPCGYLTWIVCSPYSRVQ